MEFSLVFSFVIVSVVAPFTLYKGDKCQDSFGEGFCTFFSDCSPAVKAVEEEQRSHGFLRCGFENFSEVICCPTTTTRNIQVPKSVEACENYTRGVPVFVKHQITGGQDAEIEEFPHMVALGMTDPNGGYNFDCGGTLISNKFVVTAAHCTSNLGRRQVKIVRLGKKGVPASVTNLDEKSDYEVKRVIEHHEFFRGRMKNDIALLELKKEVIFNEKIRPACLDTKGKGVEEYIIAGWGELDDNGLRKDTLQKGFVNLTSFKECDERFTKINWNLTEKSQMCTVGKVADSCLGDSGGPLLLRNSDFPVLVGINSFGQGQCGDKFPTVYTKIYNYLQWIEDLVWP